MNQALFAQLTVALVVSFTLGPAGATSAVQGPITEVVEPAATESPDQPRPTATNITQVTPRGPRRVAVAYETAAGTEETFLTSVRNDSYVGDGWAFVNESALPDPVRAADGDLSAGVLTIGDRVLLGNLTASTTTVQDNSLTIVAPSRAATNTSRVATNLASYLSDYRFTPTDGPQRVTLAALDVSTDHRGLTVGNRGYVTTPLALDDTENVWLHEYVHTQQSHELGPNMQWVAEGSSEYLAARIVTDKNPAVSEYTLQDSLTWSPGDTTRLSNTSAFAPSENTAEYVKAPRLLYVIDADIRRHSNETILTVLRELNSREGELTLTEFVHLVEQHTGQDEEWIRRSVTSSDDLVDEVAHVDPRTFQAAAPA